MFLKLLLCPSDMLEMIKEGLMSWNNQLLSACVEFCTATCDKLRRLVVVCNLSIYHPLISPSLQVEQFKMNWLEKDALHSRFDPFTGELVTDDMSWGHLQVTIF